MPAPSTSPLDGLRIAVTRAAEAGPALRDALRGVGATVVECPLTRIEWFDLAPLQAAITRLRAGDWLVCTSANGVRAVERAQVAIPVGVLIAAVGDATARAFGRSGAAVALIPSQHDARGLVDAMTAHTSLAGVRVCFPCAEGARATLADGLTGAGAIVDAVVCYASRADAVGLESLAELLRAGEVDLITLAAPSAVDGVASVMPASCDCPVAVIGPVTALAARRAGFRIAAESADASVDAMVHAIVHRFGRRADAPSPVR
jgi:uroporphyrinogen-III synthase